MKWARLWGRGDAACPHHTHERVPEEAEPAPISKTEELGRRLVLSPRRGGIEIRPWENGLKTHGASIVATLEEARQSAMEIGYVNLGRSPGDDPAIIEIWSEPDVVAKAV